MAEDRRAKLKSVSVFFPAYNDEGTIGKMVEKAIKTLRGITDDFEVIVVNDASPDKSGEIADSLAKKYPFVKVVHHKTNRGYGGALKSGFRHSTKKWVFYTDGDAQYDVSELALLAEHAGKADVINGYKIKRSDSPYRAVLGGMYNWFSRRLFHIKIRDINCDFRLMKRKIFRTVKLESDSGVICVEMIKKIQDAGFTFYEVPVRHFPRQSGKSQFFKIHRILKVFYGLARQWLRIVVLPALSGKRK